MNSCSRPHGTSRSTPSKRGSATRRAGGRGAAIEQLSAARLVRGGSTSSGCSGSSGCGAESRGRATRSSSDDPLRTREEAHAVGRVGGDVGARGLAGIAGDHRHVVLAQPRQRAALGSVLLEDPPAELVQRHVLPALDQREHLEHYATSWLRDSSARSTFSGVMGRSVIWTPIASVTALAIAGIGGGAGNSPPPLPPLGPLAD